MKILIHAHLFYPEIVDDILKCVTNFASVCGENAIRLIATYPYVKPEIGHLIADKISLPDMQIVAVENNGYDIGPFFTEVLNKANLDEYDYVVKLHTKRDTPLIWVNYRAYHGAEWRDALLSFCSTKESIIHSLAAFKTYQKLGMIADHRMINYSGSDCFDTTVKVRDLLTKIGIAPKHPVTISGSLFMTRAFLLKPFVGRFKPADFIPITADNAHKEYGVAGLLEFAFPMAVDAQGFLVSEGHWSVLIGRLGYVMQIGAYLFLRGASNSLRRMMGGNRFNALLNLFLGKSKCHV